jgi:hypothetical protein
MENQFILLQFINQSILNTLFRDLSRIGKIRTSSNSRFSFFACFKGFFFPPFHSKIKSVHQKSFCTRSQQQTTQKHEFEKSMVYLVVLTFPLYEERAPWMKSEKRESLR